MLLMQCNINAIYLPLKDIVRSPVLLTSEEGQGLIQKIDTCLKKMCGHLILSPKTDGRAG